MQLRLRLKQNLLLALASLFALSLFLPLNMVSAQSAGDLDISWTDFGHIELDHSLGDSFTKDGKTWTGLNGQKGTYTIQNGQEGYFHYTLNGREPGDCVSELWVENSGGGPGGASNRGDRIAKVQLKGQDPNSNGECETLEFTNVTGIGSPENSMIFFNWVDQGTLQAVSMLPNGTITDNRFDNTPDIRFIQVSPLRFNDSVDYFQEDSSSVRCKSYVKTGSDPAVADEMGIWSGGGSGTCDDDYFVLTGFRLGNTSNQSIPEGQGEVEAGTGSGQGDTGPSCESEGGEMSWILCAGIRIIDSALNWVDERIQGLLEVDRNTYDNPGIKGAWANIRNIAYIILVPVMLVMVIGTALGFDFVSAYTVKRALPRLIAATVFIAVSYSVTVFLIDFFNVIGNGTLGLLTSPFRQTITTPSGTVTVANLTLSSLFGGSIFSSIFTVPIGAAGAVLIIWLFGGTLFLFAAIAFLVLLLRQMFIVALLLVAPLAIIAWIFPGNDKLWKTWWGAFSKLLMMYPLIMALIAVGRIFAFVIHSGDAAGLQGAILQPLMILGAYMLPYAFIPFTFKFAGGMFATLTGAMNDKGKGLFDRQRKSRADKLERTASGNMFKSAPAGSLRSKLNTGGAGAMNIKKAGLRPSGWRPNMATALQTNTAQEVDKNLGDNKDYDTWKNNDDLNKAAAATRNASELRDYLNKHGNYSSQADLEQDVARVERVRKQMSIPAFRQMTTMQAIAGGTAYKTAGEQWAAVAAAAGNDMSAAATMVAKGRSASMSAGRVDAGGAGFGTTLGVVKDFQDKLRQNGTITQADEADGTSTIHQEVLKSQGPGVLMHSSMKPGAIKALAPELERNVQAAVQDVGVKAASGDQQALEAAQRELDQQLASLAGVYDAMAQNSPQNARVMADTVMGREITDPGSGQKASIQQLIEAKRSSPNFVEMRREYQDRASQMAAQSRSGQAGPSPTNPSSSPQGPPTSPAGP